MKKLVIAALLTATAAAQPPRPQNTLLPSIHISAPSRKPGARVDTQASLVKAARATPVRRVNLSNGMVGLVTESPEEDIVALEVLIRSGALEEAAPVSGITNLILEILEDRISNGTDGEDRIEEAGAVLKTTAELDYARISLTSTSGSFNPLLKAVAGAFEKRTISQAELDRAKKRVLNRMEGGQGAMGQLYDIFRQMFYRYHPYRTSSKGSMLAVERIEPKTVEEYFNTYFVPNRMVVSAAGRVDRLGLDEQMRGLFSKLSAIDSKVVEIAWEPKASEKEVYLQGGTSVGWLFVGFPAPPVASRDYAAMKLIHALVGEGLSSRLFTEIREKRSLAYELGAMYPVLRGPSHMVTYAISKPEQVNEARKQLLKEIERLKKEGVPQTELEESRRKVLGNYLLERETNQGKAHHLALAEMVGVGYEYDQNLLRDLQNVTPGHIQDVANRYLDNFTLIVARPAGRFYWDF